MSPIDHLLLVSAAAGGTAGAAVDAVRSVLPGAESRTVGSAAALASALDALDGRTPVVVGGDGSLHHAVTALYDRGQAGAVPVGLVPLGTGNDFARTVGLPPDDPAAAARLVASGAPRSLDLLADDAGGVAVNAVHLGVGARAARAAAPVKGLLGRAAFRVGGAVAGLASVGWRAAVEVDGEPVTRPDARVLMVAVCNGRTVGGGTPLAPDADPGDGRLDVVVAAATGPLARAAYAAALRRGRHLERPDVRHRSGLRVAVRLEPAADANADGELGEQVRARSWQVLAGAWSLLA